MTRVSLQRRQSVANNAIENLRVSITEKRIWRNDKKKKREDKEKIRFIYINGVYNRFARVSIERAEEMENGVGRVWTADGLHRPRCIFRLLIIRNFSTRCDSEKSSGEKSGKQETVVHQCPLWMHNTSTLDLQPFPFRMGTVGKKCI